MCLQDARFQVCHRATASPERAGSDATAALNIPHSVENVADAGLQDTTGAHHRTHRPHSTAAG